MNNKKLWVSYKVTVLSSGQLVPLQGGLNAIESVLDAQAHVLDTQLNPVISKSVRIVSRYDTSKFVAGGKSGLDAPDTVSDRGKDVADADIQKAVLEAKTQRPQDQAVVPQVLDTKVLVFPASMYEPLRDSHKARGKAKTRERLLAYPGFGDKSADALYKAYEEVAGQSDKTVHLLDSNEIATFHRIEGAWGDIVKLIL